MLTNPVAVNSVNGLDAGARLGLTKSGQKELPSKFFYDAVGSKLFEVISELPEYGLTRADERLVRAHSHEIVQQTPGDVMLCELGSGSGKKTKYILEAFCQRRPTDYYPIEISPAALRHCQNELSGTGGARILPIESEYLEGLSEVASQRLPGQRILVLFLGSTIGNFSPPADAEFLFDIRGILRKGDCLLLGADLEKPIPQLLRAYDDPLGVTAAFNLNLLARLNRELHANFDLDRFEHVALFNPETRGVEMHLRSTCEQTVTWPGVSIRFEAGETIWTESSHKYSLAEITRLASNTGFTCVTQWVDREWPFAETLWEAV